MSSGRNDGAGIGSSRGSTARDPGSSVGLNKGSDSALRTSEKRAADEIKVNNVSNNEKKGGVSMGQTDVAHDQTKNLHANSKSENHGGGNVDGGLERESYSSAVPGTPKAEQVRPTSPVPPNANVSNVRSSDGGSGVNNPGSTPPEPRAQGSDERKRSRARGKTGGEKDITEENDKKSLEDEGSVMGNTIWDLVKSEKSAGGAGFVGFLKDSSVGQPDNLDADIKPTDKFKLRSISASLIRCINMFREYREKPIVDEDPRLSRIAYRHSRKMALGVVQFSTIGIKDALKGLPLVCYDAFVATHDSVNQAFTAVVNNWTTEDESKESILKNVNCIGVGVSFSATRRMFFTLILGLRSFIGDCFFSHEELYSVILAQKVLEAHNLMRKNYELSKLSMDVSLLGIAYNLLKSDTTKVDMESLKSKIDPVPDLAVAFSETDVDPTAQQVVESWLTHANANDTVLGEYNRIGYAFHHDGNRLKCLRIMVRSLHASIIDGTDSIIDTTIHSKKIYQFMNDFRKQHNLEPLKLNKQLCAVAQEHSEFIANGSVGKSPIDSDFYIHEVEPAFRAIDISHISVKELSRAPKAVMKKWRNSTDCVSVLLNRVTDIGVGLCFDDLYICYCSVVIAVDAHSEPKVVNKIVNF